ncbi:hypothetical protein DVA86_09830 [Streptomyces armeniacus]|uniref:2OG-Fe dioxygenase family protein n=2 Tax=Streptomyces armeniacus TaxID=83291 RepID=A0A345Y008_9ACTN|nr:hypothetical protein DVA86_09830 [Streptomyces armeniacus]
MRRIEESLRTVGACRVPASGVRMCTGTEPEAWEVFARHWDKLEADTYAAERGTRRFRRYGAFSFDAATARTSPLSHTSFVQPENSNPLYTEVERVFEPLTDAFADDPLLHGLLRLLGRAATGLDEARTWVVKVHPFRVVASADDAGEPTPEGMHRDGVTLVSSLLVNRSNARGGRSTVTTLDGRPLLETTLGKPGTLLLGDDRSTLHGVSRVRPRDLARSARRDVLVVTFAPESGQS